MHSLKRILSSIVGSTATIKSSGTSISSSSSRLTDIPNSQYQYHHYHHQKVSGFFVRDRNKTANTQQHFFFSFYSKLCVFFFLRTYFPAYSFIFHNNAIKFKSGASSALFGCVFIYTINMDALW